jgi:hypothetical protein
MGQMLQPLISTYYERKVHPAYIAAMDSTKAVVDRLSPMGNDRQMLMRQLNDAVAGLEQAQSMTTIGMQLGTEMNATTQQSIDRLANHVQRFPGGPKAAADLKAVSNLISHRRISEELFK